MYSVPQSLSLRNGDHQIIGVHSHMTHFSFVEDGLQLNIFLLSGLRLNLFSLNVADYLSDDKSGL